MEKTKKQEKTLKILKRTIGVLFVVLLLIGSYEILSYYQRSRYDVDNYNCVDMSADCKDFFEKLGISTTTMHGRRTRNDGTLQGHCWLEISCYSPDNKEQYER